MEQLRVLAGEPLLVIDFRYHLVSLIAVFLAIALGIVIGTTQLNGKVLDDLRGQVSSLEQDKRSLEDNTQQLQAQQDDAQAFTAAVAPALVHGSLTGRSVALVITDDQVSSDTVDEVTALIGQAGGTVTGTIRLRPAYTDPAAAARIQAYVTGPGLPAGFSPPATGDGAQALAALLAAVLVRHPGGTGPGTAATASVLAGLAALDVLTQVSPQVAPADHAVVLTAGGGSGADRTAPLVDLAAALDAAGSGTVVAGTADAAGPGGLVAAVRADPAVSAAVSTVDDVGTTAGRVSTVLALPRERAGRSGRYGTADGDQPVPAVPGSTP
jgi:hypothetical protein